MLLAASAVNPRAELVGVDIDARCAKITAVNLGLRSKYGYVVCGNSLSGEMQFAYRIGHFYHEGPNGRRRGVIRDIAPEDTPVPVIASRLRSQSADLFEQSEHVEPHPEALPEVGLPIIMEVPQWLARLEPALAALEGGEQVSGEIQERDTSSNPDSLPNDDDEKQVELSPGETDHEMSDHDPPQQRELF